MTEDVAVHPGRIIQFAGMDKLQGTKKSSADDDSSAMSGTSWSVLSFGRDQVVSTEDVKDKEIADRNGRRGKYTGTCIVPPSRVGGRLFPHGKGVMAYYSGMMYNGEWSKGRWEGHGKVDYSPNNYYAGSFVRGRFSGEGLRGFANGSEYEGGWKDGKRSGKGTFRNDKGDVFDGHCLKGKLNGEGRVRYASGDFYEGECDAAVHRFRLCVEVFSCDQRVLRRRDERRIRDIRFAFWSRI